MKISTTNMRKKDGSKLVNGYKIALQKSEVERIGMGEYTDLVPFYEDGKITLLEVGRIFVSYYYKGQLYCWCYRKIKDNLYEKDNYVFITDEAGIEIAKEFENKPLPEDMLETSKRSGNLILCWKGKKYPQSVNYN